MDGTTCISDGGAYATANPLYQEGNYLLERRFRKMHVDKRHAATAAALTTGGVAAAAAAASAMMMATASEKRALSRDQCASPEILMK